MLAAPLIAWLVPNRAAIAAYAAVGALVVALTVADDPAKRLASDSWPWNLTRTEAMRSNSRANYALQTAGLDAAVPSGCLGAIVTESDPTYYLYGSRFQRQIIYLKQGNPVSQAQADRLNKVVVSESLPYEVNQLVSDGWKIRPLGGGWDLATRRLAPGAACNA